jgi:hypothetical protein
MTPSEGLLIEYTILLIKLGMTIILIYAFWFGLEWYFTKRKQRSKKE